MRVYLVEDSEILAPLVIEMLESLDGIEVVGRADNASDAIRDMMNLEPDVMIVDLQLRRGNGFDVLKAMNRLPSKPPPISMVLTNCASPPMRHAANRAGAAYFFDKGSEISDMFKTISGLAMDGGRSPLAVAT